MNEGQFHRRIGPGTYFSRSVTALNGPTRPRIHFGPIGNDRRPFAQIADWDADESVRGGHVLVLHVVNQPLRRPVRAESDLVLRPLSGLSHFKQVQTVITQLVGATDTLVRVPLRLARGVHDEEVGVAIVVAGSEDVALEVLGLARHGAVGHGLVELGDVDALLSPESRGGGGEECFVHVLNGRDLKARVCGIREGSVLDLPDDSRDIVHVVVIVGLGVVGTAVDGIVSELQDRVVKHVTCMGDGLVQVGPLVDLILNANGRSQC